MRVGLLGCGAWGRHIARDLITLGADVVVADPEPAARAAASEAGAAAVGSVAELPGCDGYVVATPPGTHADVVEALADRGRPVFVEKPLAVSTAQVARIRATGLPVFVMEKWRYHPGVEWIAARVRDGSYGALRALRLERLQWALADPAVDPLWELLPHDVSIAAEIVGDLPAVATCTVVRLSFAQTRLTARLGGPGAGPVVFVDTGTGSPRRSRRVEAVLDDAVLVLGDGWDRSVEVRAVGADEPQQVPVDAALPLERELAAFLAHLAGGPPPRSSLAEGARTVAVIEQLLATAKIGR